MAAADAAGRSTAAGGGSGSGPKQRASALRRGQRRPVGRVVCHYGPEPVVELLLDDARADDEQRHHRASAREAVRGHGGREVGGYAAPLVEELGAADGPHPLARVALIEPEVEVEEPAAVRLLLDGAAIPVAEEDSDEDFPVLQQPSGNSAEGPGPGPRRPFPRPPGAGDPWGAGPAARARSTGS